MDIKQARKLRTALECRSPRFVTSAVTIEGIRATRDGRIDTRAETDRNVVVFEAKVDGTTKSLVTFEAACGSRGECSIPARPFELGYWADEVLRLANMQRREIREERWVVASIKGINRKALEAIADRRFAPKIAPNNKHKLLVDLYGEEVFRIKPDVDPIFAAETIVKGLAIVRRELAKKIDAGKTVETKLVGLEATADELKELLKAKVLGFGAVGAANKVTELSDLVSGLVKKVVEEALAAVPDLSKVI